MAQARGGQFLLHLAGFALHAQRIALQAAQARTLLGEVDFLLQELFTRDEVLVGQALVALACVFGDLQAGFLLLDLSGDGGGFAAQGVGPALQVGQLVGLHFLGAFDFLFQRALAFSHLASDVGLQFAGAFALPVAAENVEQVALFHQLAVAHPLFQAPRRTVACAPGSGRLRASAGHPR